MLRTNNKKSKWFFFCDTVIRIDKKKSLAENHFFLKCKRNPTQLTSRPIDQYVTGNIRLQIWSEFGNLNSLLFFDLFRSKPQNRFDKCGNFFRIWPPSKCELLLQKFRLVFCFGKTCYLLIMDRTFKNKLLQTQFILSSQFVVGDLQVTNTFHFSSYLYCSVNAESLWLKLWKLRS